MGSKKTAARSLSGKVESGNRPPLPFSVKARPLVCTESRDSATAAAGGGVRRDQDRKEGRALRPRRDRVPAAWAPEREALCPPAPDLRALLPRAAETRTELRPSTSSASATSTARPSGPSSSGAQTPTPPTASSARLHPAVAAEHHLGPDRRGHAGARRRLFLTASLKQDRRSGAPCTGAGRPGRRAQAVRDRVQRPRRHPGPHLLGGRDTQHVISLEGVELPVEECHPCR